MNVMLPPEFEAFARAEVEAGRFGSVAEVVREALLLYEEQARWEAEELPRLRSELAVALEQEARGEVRPFQIQDVLREARARRAAKRG